MSHCARRTGGPIGWALFLLVVALALAASALCGCYDFEALSRLYRPDGDAVGAVDGGPVDAELADVAAGTPLDAAAGGGGDLARGDSGAVATPPAPDLAPCGECAPGETRQGGCYQCSRQSCGTDCRWGPCALEPGNACDYHVVSEVALPYRSCACNAPCSSGMQQRCRSDCQWGPCKCAGLVCN